MNRRVILAIVAAVAVFSAGIGWVAGQRIKSPAEIAAQTDAPEPSLITVPVEQRALSSNVVIRGQAEFDDATDIGVSGSTSGASIITRLTKEANQKLEEGDVVIEVAGRPLIVLEGQLPIFRSLTPGLEGPDVLQLEEALARQGFDPGTVDKVYDANTEAAVADLYRKAGYSPDEPTTEELAQVESARQRVDGARSAVRSAQQQVNQSGVSESTKLQLDQQVRTAQNGLDDATTIANAAKAEAANVSAAAKSAHDNAWAAVTLATERLSQAEAGTHPDTGAAPTAAELDNLRAAKSDAIANEANAQAGLDEATAAQAAVTLEQDRMWADANTELAIQIASRKETLAQSGAGDARSQLSDAKKSLTEAQSDLAKADAEVGIEFPASELLFLPSLPREIQRVNVAIGDTPEGSVMRVTGSGVVIRSAVSATDRPLIKEGAEAIMANDDLGISVPATVTFVATTPGGPNASADRYAIRLEPLDPLPEEGFDQNYRVTIPIESTSGDVLVVPLAALSAGADGTARVEIEHSPGQTNIIKVKTGLSSQGFVEISALEGTLEAGDRVVVGRDSNFSVTDSESSDSDSSDSSDGGSDTDLPDTNSDSPDTDSPDSTDSPAEETDG